MKKILILFILVLFVQNIFCIEIVSKEYREQYSPENSKSDYYKLQMKTASFFDKQTSSVNGLVESHRGTSVYCYDFFTRSFILGNGGVLDAQAFIYDNAIASLSYLLAGQNNKVVKILRVCQKEFYSKKDEGRFGLYNAYKTDVPRKRWGLTPGIDGNRVHLGPNIWIAVSAFQYTALTGKLNFLQFAIDTLKWASEINHYKFSNGELGAASMGYGWTPPDWSKIYSTENVVDHYAALKMAKDIYYNSNVDVKSYFEKAHYGIEDINAEIENIERWLVKLIYDKNKRTLNMGYNERGVDKTDALDTVSWAITALTPERLTELGIDPFHLMDFADEEYFVTDKIGDQEVSGYDFTNQKGRRKNYRMVWFEGTCFHITTIQVMADYAKKLGKKDMVEEYKKQAVSLLEEVEKVSSLINLIDNSLPYTSKKPTEKQIFTTFADYWEIPRGKDGSWVASSSSTGWHLIASSAFNPLHFNKETVDYKLFRNKKDVIN
jgi:hypothetical protein